MSGFLERAASAFVTLPPEPAVAVAPPRFAARALVLGSVRDAVPVGAALAGGLRERAPSAVLVTWPAPAAPRPALGTPGASRLVAGLQARGLAVVARGRLAWIALGDGELGLARRALAVVDVPVVVAITGPRSAASDALLAEQDLVVLVVPPDADARVAALVEEQLTEENVPFSARAPLTAPGARTTALAGWGRLKVTP